MIRNALCMQLRAAHLGVHRAAQQHFAPFGITVEQFIVLAVLLEEDGVTQQVLVKRACSDARTIGKMLNLLEGKRLLTRDDHPTDGRARHVCLTDAGRKTARKLMRTFDGICTDLEASLPADERKIVAGWLERIAQMMSDSHARRKADGRRRKKAR